MLEERKQPNPSEEQESIGKENTIGDKIQKETLDAPLYPIPLKGKEVEKIKPPITSITKGVVKDKPYQLSPKEALMEKSCAQETKGLKKTRIIRIPQDLALTTGKVIESSKSSPPEIELKEKENSQENLIQSEVPGKTPTGTRRYIL